MLGNPEEPRPESSTEDSDCMLCASHVNFAWIFHVTIRALIMWQVFFAIL